MRYVWCQALRWVDDEPQPGLVEVRLNDIHGDEHVFIDKEPIFTPDSSLGPQTAYPVRVELGCEVLSTRVLHDGRTAHTITTVRPWDIESVTGQTEFEVALDQFAD
ncbi:hypothetical protein NONI108955_41360 [Nocardia ninae]|uniref:hypothetical protein n=1 Tax=Nocardia ninae TaxID=356145 RepID=UPI0011BF9516|nr:hypothetical protein [Nocardia ninae]